MDELYEGAGGERRVAAEDAAWGGRCGCLAAGAIGLPILFMGLVIVRMGECWPHAGCHQHDGFWMLAVAGVVLGLGVLIRVQFGRFAASLGARRASLGFWIGAAAVAALAAWVAYIPGIF
jgi:hypothetical protein